MRFVCALAGFLVASTALAQHGTGELILSVVDESGAAIRSTGVLANQAAEIHHSFTTDPQGSADFRTLPYGTYRLTLERQGFAPSSQLVEIRSAAPTRLTVTMRVAPIGTAVVIREDATLIDPRQTGSDFHIGTDELTERKLSAPGRSLLELVDSQPGWLVEANGVLHPRGSEYDTQYVIDGLPVVDNRSPVFAPELDADDVQSMHVLTAGFPAEYGRKLGGVVEVFTSRDARLGLHGKSSWSGGSFGSLDGFLAMQYGFRRTTIGVSADASMTDRYLDPPVEENYTNNGTTRGASLRLEHDWSASDRTRVALQRRSAAFEVPDETTQQLAGQRQDRDSVEVASQLSHQHIFTPGLIGNIRGMVRDISANLWSNDLSTPIQPSQQRGFRESYLNASLAGTHGVNDWKMGVEASFASVSEAFAYRITDPDFFGPATPVSFSFADRRQDREQSLFAQDVLRLGRLTLSAGLRWDHYKLMLDDSAVSPRLGAAWYFPSAGLLLRASYDRAFQTPAIENLLLASSPAVERLNDNVLRLPVPASRGNFYQVGFAKALFGHLRLESNWFRRDFNQFSDDDVLLNTGVSFPIAFASAGIRGIEAKLEIPRWGPFSGFVSYANMIGTGRFPITGGLFLAEDATGLLRSTERFPITQDQRNTARARMRWQLHPRLWTAWGAAYGSGLPVELDTTDPSAFTGYSDRILSRVNFSRGRVRPSFSLDLSAGAQLWSKEQRALRFQADVANLTNRLNVINFAGVFSGTAVAPPRSFGLRLQADF